MSATMQSGLNGRVRKSLAFQLDRLDSILDGLAEALNGAVSEAVKQAVGTAAREAVKVALAEAMPQETAKKPAEPVPPPQRLGSQVKAKAKGAFSGMKWFFTSAVQKVKQCCTRYSVPAVLAAQSAMATVRSRTMRVGMLLGAVASCVMGLFRKESKRLWWGAGIVLSTMLLESYFGTLGTLLLGGGVIYLATQGKAIGRLPPVAVKQAA